MYIDIEKISDLQKYDNDTKKNVTSIYLYPTVWDMNTNKCSEVLKSVLEFPNITELEIHNCILGIIPKEISQLKHLERLVFNRCCIADVSDKIGELENLTTLQISNNPNLTNIPKTIDNMQNLSSLILHNNNLKEFPHILHMKNIKVLNIKGNELLYDLDIDMKYLNKLHELSYLNNHFIKHVGMDIIKCIIRDEPVKYDKECYYSDDDYDRDNYIKSDRYYDDYGCSDYDYYSDKYLEPDCRIIKEYQNIIDQQKEIINEYKSIINEYKNKHEKYDCKNDWIVM